MTACDPSELCNKPHSHGIVYAHLQGLRNKQTLTPVTIRQLVTATYDAASESFKLDGKDLSGSCAASFPGFSSLARECVIERGMRDTSHVRSATARRLD